MVHQFLQREDVEPWTAPTTIYRFWIRRFFRIAPLSYPLLVLSWASPAYVELQEFLSERSFPIPWATPIPTPALRKLTVG
jgi:hypothetical protein